MFRQIERILHVGSFEVNSRFLVYTDDKPVPFRSLYVNRVIIPQIKVTGYYATEQYVLAASPEPKIYLIQNDSPELLLNGYSLSPRPIEKNKFIVSKKTTANTFDNFVYDLDKNVIEDQIPGYIKPWSVADETYGFYRNTEEVVAVDLKTRNVAWIVDFSEMGSHVDMWGEKSKGRVVNIIGVYDGILWMSITNHTLLGLIASSGQVKYHLRDIPEFKSTWLPSAIPDEYSMKLDRTKGKIIGLRWEFYWEIDCKSGSIDFNDMTALFQHEGIRSEVPDFAYDGTNIHFLQQNPPRVASLNTVTKLIDWKYSFDDIESPLVLKEIKFSNNRLYVLDTGGTLHILEKIGAK